MSKINETIVPQQIVESDGMLDSHRTINLDEMMKEYQLGSTLLDLGEIPLTDAEKSSILSNSLKKCGLEDTHHTPHLRFRTLLVACIFILATFTLSFAAYQYVVSANALGFFKPHNAKQIAALNSLGTTIDKQVSDEGLTIHVKEVIGDRHTANLLFDVIVSKEKVVNEFQYDFRSTRIHIPRSSSMGWHVEQLNDENPKDNVIPMILSMDTRKELIGKEIELQFTDFIYYNIESTSAEDSMIPVVPGDWNISFELNYKDNSIHYKPNRKIQAFGGEVKVKEIILSPISATIKLQGFDLNLYDKNPPAIESSDSTMEDLIIHLKDGTTFQNFSSSGRSTGGITMISNYSFAEVIDLSQLDFLEYKGAKFDLKE